MIKRATSILAAAAFVLALPASSLAAGPAVVGSAPPTSAPSMSMSFAPATIYAGRNSTLTMTLSNPDATAMSDVKFTATLPSGVNAASTSKSACGGTLSVSGKTIAFTAGTLAANGKCSMTITVTGATSGRYSLSATPANGATTGTAAKASLRVLRVPVVTMQLDFSVVSSSEATGLSVTIDNPNDIAIPGVSFTFTVPEQLSIWSDILNFPATCGEKVTTDPGEVVGNTMRHHFVTLSGITLPKAGTCVTHFSAGSYSGVRGGSYTLTTGAIKTPYGSIQAASAPFTLVQPEPVTVDATPSPSPKPEASPSASPRPTPQPTPQPASPAPALPASNDPGVPGLLLPLVGLGGLAVLAAVVGLLWRRGWRSVRSS
jgi:hypothetical protein